MREEMDGEVFISRQSRHFAYAVCMIKLIFPICTSTWRVNNYVFRQGKGINRRNESRFLMKYCIVPSVQFRVLINLFNLC